MIFAGRHTYGGQTVAYIGTIDALTACMPEMIFNGTHIGQTVAYTGGGLDTIVHTCVTIVHSCVFHNIITTRVRTHICGQKAYIR